MWPYHPDLLETPVPRYTSYPTAADFGDLDSAAYPHALEQAQSDISLYLHIPFCESICFYCGCNTGRANRRQRLESYLAALHREIETVAAHLPAGARIRRVTFGGGSPNAVSAVDMLRLVDALTVHLPLDNPVFSTELDPRTMSREWAQAMQAIGFTWASLGVQTFAPHCQAAIGRVQSEDVIAKSVDWLRDAGVTSLNFDLMYGLPGQTRDDLRDTLARTCRFGADRVALFGYAHVPHIVPRQRAIDASALPDQAERFAMAALGYETLCSEGYTAVGFDHFARNGSDPLALAAEAGQVRRNFQGFTDDQAPVLIGLGASAISSFPHLLAQNEKNAGRYRMIASHGGLSASRGIMRSPEDKRRGDVIESLLCTGSAQIPSAMLTPHTDTLQRFIARQLVTLNNQRLTILPDGLPYARTIASLFDSYRQGAQIRFSSAV